VINMTWASWIDFLLGAWLVIAPFALGFSAVSRGATIDSVVFGILIAIFGLWTALRKDAPRISEWLLMLFGLWVLVSPFVMGMEAIARVTPNNVIVGIFVLLFGIVRLASSHGPARTQAA
jgi:hypothetical protein